MLMQTNLKDGNEFYNLCTQLGYFNESRKNTWSSILFENSSLSSTGFRRKTGAIVMLGFTSNGAKIWHFSPTVSSYKDKTSRINQRLINKYGSLRFIGGHQLHILFLFFRNKQDYETDKNQQFQFNISFGF